MTIRKTPILFHWIATSADRERVRPRDEVRDGLEVDAVERKRDVLDDERDADGGDQRREPRRVAERLVRDALDGRVEEREERHRDRERREQPDDDQEDARLVVQPEDRHDHRARDEPGEREDVAVGEVDELEDPVDERVPERDEPVDRAVRRADDRDVQEPRRVLEELDREPEDDQREEEQPDRVDQARASDALQCRCRGRHRSATLNRKRREGNALPLLDRATQC